MSELDSNAFRRVLSHYPTGVAVVTARGNDGELIGMVVGSFSSVSLDPPLVAFMPAKNSSTYARLKTASSFCVNVLTAEQEYLCRQFASKGTDKFAGVSLSAAPSGAPVIDGAVAWIDCQAHQALDAGDHDIVLGRVTDLEVVNPTSPLLFFQGGYGGFSPRSLVAPYASDLRTHLQIADLAREHMERLSADLDMACYAQALVGDELVVVAGVGSETSSAHPHIGRRLPFVPPFGTLFVADQGEAAAESWLARLGTTVTTQDRALYLGMLDRVRARGWSLGLVAPAHDEIWAELERFGSPEGAADLAGRLPELMSGLKSCYEPEMPAPDERHDVRIMGVPVHGPAGKVAQVLVLFGMPRQASVEQISGWRARLQQAASEISKAIVENRA